MLLLRIGRRARWEVGTGATPTSQQIEDAARDLQLGPDEVGLSVFRVEVTADFQEVAVRFALTCRDRSAHVDYVIFPEELAVDLGLDVTGVPVPTLDAYLSGRHYEILGLTADLARNLAEAILESPEHRVGRVRDRDLASLGAAICRSDHSLRDYLRGDWFSKLSPLLGEPPHNA